MSRRTQDSLLFLVTLAVPIAAQYRGEGPGVLGGLVASSVQANLPFPAIHGIDLTPHASLGSGRAYVALELPVPLGVASGVYDFTSDTFVANQDVATLAAAGARSLSISPDLLVAVSETATGPMLASRSSPTVPFGPAVRIQGVAGGNPDITRFDGAYWLVHAGTLGTAPALMLSLLDMATATTSPRFPVATVASLQGSWPSVNALSTPRVIGDGEGGGTLEDLAVFFRASTASGRHAVFFAARVSPVHPVFATTPAFSTFEQTPFQLGPMGVFGGRAFFGGWSGTLFEADVLATTSVRVPRSGGVAHLTTIAPPRPAGAFLVYAFGALRAQGLPLPLLCGAPLSIDPLVTLVVGAAPHGTTRLDLAIGSAGTLALPGQVVELDVRSGQLCSGNTFWLATY